MDRYAGGTLIDPTKITDFNRNQQQLQELLLFCIIVAGKKASIQAQKLEQFLTTGNPKGFMPFGYIRYCIKTGTLLERIKEAKLGQYTKIEKAFKQAIQIDVERCTVQDLEKVHGIGSKTSRFFLLHSRRNQRVAVLDTHILRWMREELGIETPKSTPSSNQYARLEAEFLTYCDKTKQNPATLDLKIWNKYSSGVQKKS